MSYGQTFSRKIALIDTAETAELTNEFYCFKGFPLDHLIWAVAVKGCADDWAVYIQTPHMDQEADIIKGGIKLHEHAARLIFPEWADRLKYRR